MIELHSKPGIFPGLVIKSWRVTAPFRAARFVCPHNPARFCIVHPSTKVSGCWQTSHFDEFGAIGDNHRATAANAVSEVSPYGFVLAEVTR